MKWCSWKQNAALMERCLLRQEHCRIGCHLRMTMGKTFLLLDRERFREKLSLQPTLLPWPRLPTLQRRLLQADFSPVNVSTMQHRCLPQKSEFSIRLLLSLRLEFRERFQSLQAHCRTA